MKRKSLMLLVVSAMLCATLSACGKKEVSKQDDKVVVEDTQQEIVQEEPAVEPAVEPAPKPEPEPEPEVVEEPEPEPELRSSFLEDKGIAITPQGDCEVNFWGGDADGNYFGDFDGKVNTAISETKDDAPEGFKKVTCLFTIDVNDNPGNSFKFWSSAFDRYTGTSFEFDNSGTYTVQGEHTTKAGFVTVQDGENYYDVSIEFNTQNEYPILYKSITVTCPEDYEGTVFQIGYFSPELSDANSQIDYKARLYTIDELPFYGDGYLYFTKTND